MKFFHPRPRMKIQEKKVEAIGNSSTREKPQRGALRKMKIAKEVKWKDGPTQECQGFGELGARRDFFFLCLLCKEANEILTIMVGKVYLYPNWIAHIKILIWLGPLDPNMWLNPVQANHAALKLQPSNQLIIKIYADHLKATAARPCGKI